MFAKLSSSHHTTGYAHKGECARSKQPRIYFRKLNYNATSKIIMLSSLY